METEPRSTYSALLYAPRRLHVNEAVIALISCVTPTIILALAAGIPWGLVALGFGCASALVTTRRAFRIRLLITEKGVRIYNYWRSYEFPWSDVKAVRIGLKNQGVLPQPALGFGLKSGVVRFAQATPFRANERQEFQAAVLVLAPSSVEALPDTAGIIGSEKAPSNVIRRWWMKGQPARQTNRIERDRMVWIEQPFGPPSLLLAGVGLVAAALALVAGVSLLVGSIESGAQTSHYLVALALLLVGACAESAGLLVLIRRRSHQRGSGSAHDGSETSEYR